MFWFILLAVVVYILYRFLSALNKDNQELENLSLADKFKSLIDELNEKAFDLEATVHMRNKRSFYLHLKGGNQIVEFFYSTGHLTIQWKFTFTRFGSEVVFEHQVNDVRDLGARSQIALANSILHDVENLFKIKAPHAVSYYSYINKSGFLFKESHAILVEMKELILRGIPYHDINNDEVNYEDNDDWEADFDLMNDEASILSIFNDLTRGQKMSIMNAMMFIGFSDGDLGNRDKEAVCLNKYLILFGLDSKSVMGYYKDAGIKQMFTDLIPLSEKQKKMLAYLLTEMMISDGKPNKQEVNASMGILEKIGVDNDTYISYTNAYLKHKNFL